MSFFCSSSVHGTSDEFRSPRHLSQIGYKGFWRSDGQSSLGDPSRRLLAKRGFLRVDDRGVGTLGQSSLGYFDALPHEEGLFES